MRSVAPIASGDSVSRRAHTGPPASASTALTPTVRSSVLLPDMFDPLTSSRRGRGPLPSRPAPRRSERPRPRAGAGGPRPPRRSAAPPRRRRRCREGQLGVLVRVGRQRGERLDLADHRQPAADGRTECPPPALDGEPELRGPEQRRHQDADHLVAARLHQADQARQAGDAARRRLAAPAAVGRRVQRRA